MIESQHVRNCKGRRRDGYRTIPLENNGSGMCTFEKLPKALNRHQSLDYAHGVWDSETQLGTQLGRLGERWVLSQ